MQPEQPQRYKASAPGSMMLLGEYAVLHDSPALVCAVNKRIAVTLTPREDNEIHIHSVLHGTYKTNLTDFIIIRPFHFVMGALQYFRESLKQGCDLYIASAFSDKVGFGSSAAVTVATLSVLSAWQKKPWSPADLLRHGRQVIRQVQGTGSGADVAASVYGGLVAYSAQSMRAEKIADTHPITALYSGFKTPTVDAIQRVQTHFSASPSLFQQICRGIKQCAMDGIQCAKNQDWQGLGRLMNTQQGLMDALGVNLPLLQKMVWALRDEESICGAKISGSGLGDCVIGLGDAAKDFACESLSQQFKVERIPVAMTTEGVHCEKI